MRLRVIVADDNPRMLDQLVSLLRSDFEVVAVATDGGSARECIQRYKPDVAILDIVMPRINGVELTKELSMNGHSTHVVICSIETDEDTIRAARDAGALGYVFKARMARDLVSAVRSVAAGRPFTSSK